MTTGAVIIKIQLLMIGVHGSHEVILMATKAIGRSIGKIPSGMALSTVSDVMSQGQREKVMQNVLGIPAKAQRIVAFDAISRIASLNVIGVRRCGIIILVTVETFIAEPVKTQVGFIDVAFDTSQVGMSPDQWEAIFLM